MSEVQPYIADGRVLELIESFLKQDILEDLARVDAGKGHAPRGGDQPAAVQPLPASGGQGDGGGGIRDDPLCG